MPGAQQSRLQLLSRVVNEPGPYRPIDCGVHDRLLALATRGQLCDLDVAAPGFGAHRIHGVIVNVYSEAGAEFLRLADGRQFRLDTIRAIDGKPVLSAELATPPRRAGARDRRIDYVELPARDLGAVRDFYSAAFGWTFEDYGPEYLAFSDGRVDGGFYRSPLSSSSESGAALVILYADDLEATERLVRQCGGEIVKEIFPFPGGRRFHFTDPAGNELAVWSDQGASPTR